jgi:hypothetical protein
MPQVVNVGGSEKLELAPGSDIYIKALKDSFGEDAYAVPGFSETGYQVVQIAGGAQGKGDESLGAVCALLGTKLPTEMVMELLRKQMWEMGARVNFIDTQPAASKQDLHNLDMTVGVQAVGAGAQREGSSGQRWFNMKSFTILSRFKGVLENSDQASGIVYRVMTELSSDARKWTMQSGGVKLAIPLRLDNVRPSAPTAAMVVHLPQSYTEAMEKRPLIDVSVMRVNLTKWPEVAEHVLRELVAHQEVGPGEARFAHDATLMTLRNHANAMISKYVQGNSRLLGLIPCGVPQIIDSRALRDDQGRTIAHGFELVFSNIDQGPLVKEWMERISMEFPALDILPYGASMQWLETHKADVYLGKYDKSSGAFVGGFTRASPLSKGAFSDAGKVSGLAALQKDIEEELLRPETASEILTLAGRDVGKNMSDLQKRTWAQGIAKPLGNLLLKHVSALQQSTSAELRGVKQELHDSKSQISDLRQAALRSEEQIGLLRQELRKLQSGGSAVLQIAASGDDITASTELSESSMKDA